MKNGEIKWVKVKFHELLTSPPTALAWIVVVHTQIIDVIPAQEVGGRIRSVVEEDCAVRNLAMKASVQRK
jgi:hypothetical protein